MRNAAFDKLRRVKVGMRKGECGCGNAECGRRKGECGSRNAECEGGIGRNGEVGNRPADF